MSKKNTYTRRSALALLGSGGALAVSGTAGNRLTVNTLLRDGTLEVADSIIVTDRQENGLGSDNFGNYDPRNPGGRTYLEVTNESGTEVSVSPSNDNVTVSYEPDDSVIGATENITIRHTENSEQTSALSIVPSTDVPQELRLKTQIPIPVAPNSAVSRWTMNSGDIDTGTSPDTSTDVWGSHDLDIDSSVSTGQSSNTGTYNTGESYQFDGSTNTPVNGLYGANISEFSGEQTHSFAVWMYINSATPKAVLHMGEYGGNGDDRAIGLWLEDSNTLNYYFWGNDLKYNVDYQGKWVHVVGTYSGGTADSTNKKLYVDGVEQTVANKSTDTPALNLPSGPEVQIGSRTDEGRLDGSLSDVRIYDRALSSTEVSNLYQTGYING